MLLSRLGRSALLRLPAFSTKSVRVRQHVNPLSRRFQEPIAVPDWTSIYHPSSSPAKVHLDIGCARAQYLMALAAQEPETCFLGVEIREPLVHEALVRVQELQLRNVHIVHANMNVHMDALLASLRATTLFSVGSVSIFHPDPWMKKKHIKRRLVTDAFVRDLARHLDDGTPVHLQSDVVDLFEYMVDIFRTCPDYVDIGPGASNAMGLPTDRERFVVNEGGAIYRKTFRRTVK
ncbi:Aste57867_12047 [Aphanomyces stellatus]|uniref:tRNA (guanine(46)-N(7))-methyltransferase n=1 Tax=Aphanomyces stellatus TaxID=120398 RepID=A0A485KUK6_9STRA|nr:hypothetical protein As57867_012002 [Aphanomyces stellatus]VFT88902.1 Aste57867_12047 [Aphanomyces stellatus]